ncbi:UDP-3-O-(3-hydroxymyristoyl)glucosamine N-acyltransferase [Pontibacter sp. BT310]|uniref:UDP-3-O-acylglucosamine N-acyltransferase n=1 Tax=Pontibacter populi TaxID=890055 RepID=A0ABS6XC04_9BACT|nr:MULTISPECIES: UDP-3-O-(3-hydroxymyristoyl)glucosamine N-acyltransferase [Pontibacter]MBJ6118667.1 UDP-3-O-(3-hydroxymyristoyl)glucosamine N-acyltransferase [Pontibacter sp. BT310]MBR0571096.1 UDP-3-O-(3-hydroxymyristoyl)glucosamine N-acyltransferase [Microvirga sp. STS03]MBW3365521.1 UDP-3-O-(3-hydroxymyristoyl)glucosamine N-acyltransferase [Pontibacter populi]
MEFTVQQIADLLQGVIEGDNLAKVSTLAKIEEAQTGALAFLSNPKYEPYLYTTGASAVIVSDKLELKKPVSAALIRVSDPYSSFSTLLQYYQAALLASKTGVEEPCFIGSGSEIGEDHYRGAFSYIGANCKIGTNVRIFPQVYIGDNVTIGDNTTIFAGAKLYSNTIVGSNCTLHAGVVLGSDGFGFAPQPDGSYKMVPQIGNVVLEDDISIGANTTIDCATMGSTIIRQGTKIDNLVQIAHNVEVGKHTVIAAQTGISGSAKIGNHCVIAGQVGIVGHITIADRTTVGAQSGVGKTIKKSGTIIQGSPAFDYKQNLRALTVFRKLPELQREIEALRDRI